MANLLNCVTRNHRSVEYGGDSVNLDALPSHVLIEVWPDLDAGPPPDAPTGEEGFWTVSMINFTISGVSISDAYYPGLSPSTLFDGQTAGYEEFAMNNNVIIDIGNTNKWVVYRYADMAGSVDGEANWDQNIVEYVMLVDTEGGGTQKNKVFVYVKLLDNYIIGAEDVTVNIDIDGYAVWVPLEG